MFSSTDFIYNYQTFWYMISFPGSNNEKLVTHSHFQMINEGTNSVYVKVMITGT